MQDRSAEAGLDWPAMIRTGLHLKGLTPEVFWQLTPFELQQLTGAFQGSDTLNRTGFEALLARFPDDRHGAKDDTV